MVPPSEDSTPSMIALLEELGVQKTSPNIRGKTEQVFLKESQMEKVVHFHNSLSQNEELITKACVEPLAKSSSTLNQKRNEEAITFHTEQFDLGKRTAAHYVAWLGKSSPFTQDSHSVSDFSQIHFGKITDLLSVQVGKTNHKFAKVKEFSVVQYMFGGMWKCDLNQSRKDFLPLLCLSEPLYTGKLDCTDCDNIWFLNSKMKYSPTEARTILDHIKPR